MDTTLYCEKCKKVGIDETDVEDDRTHFRCGGKVDRVCEFCLGTGEVETDEQVYPNEPHYARIGIAKCVCQTNNK